MISGGLCGADIADIICTSWKLRQKVLAYLQCFKPLSRLEDLNRLKALLPVSPLRPLSHSQQP
ncbi:hypothetical protein PILCRDRAFT_823812 [Piloderma croceum F 1598]|uniref:Uncharacterized protein n=1 Tax=Piloderma croceum (strain F 1598) TaxID=765440 RepID=A0A0C3F393_PILCF|nr:hypothetical protein PILCRDRAFT_823812 [Piloderma croceum F 1598]